MSIFFINNFANNLQIKIDVFNKNASFEKKNIFVCVSNF